MIPFRLPPRLPLGFPKGYDKAKGSLLSSLIVFDSHRHSGTAQVSDLLCSESVIRVEGSGFDARGFCPNHENKNPAQGEKAYIVEARLPMSGIVLSRKLKKSSYNVNQFSHWLPTRGICAFSGSESTRKNVRQETMRNPPHVNPE